MKKMTGMRSQAAEGRNRGLEKVPKTGLLNKQESGGSSAESSYFLIEATFT
jgi:hypothetical protein